MKFRIFTVAILFGLSLSSHAQKLATRTGMVKFFSETKMENIEAINNQVSSVITTEDGKFAFLVPIKAFVFEKALMQEHFNENYMESDVYSNASFKGTIENIAQVNFDKDGVYETTFSGIMNIHGKDQKVSLPVTIMVKGEKVTLNSKFRVKASDYDVKIPAGKSDNISNDLAITVKMDYAK